MKSVEKFAKILRIKEENILSVCNSMGEVCQTKGALERVMAENDFKVKEVLSVLKLSRDDDSHKVYNAIIEKLKRDDQRLFEILGEPKCNSKESCNNMVSILKELSGVGPRHFLKENVAKEMLMKAPPENILKALGYRDTEELLAKEDLKQVYSALRFVETSEWMNEKFIPLYDELRPDDFEERDIEVIVIEGKWMKVAEKFIQKKYHNVSHLKELGVVFIIPLEVNTPGEMLRVFTLVLHYLHEVTFYAKLFNKYLESNAIGKKIVSLIRGDVTENKLEGNNEWRIVQRYLAKDDPDDFRLFEPHVNPETLHWDKAENNLTQLDARYDDLDFTFWKNLNFVGDFFPNKGEKELVSFNLIDSIMSLVKEKERIKYLYHHQEALWNRIFEEFVGKAKMEEMIIDNFEQGYIDINKEYKK